MKFLKLAALAAAALPAAAFAQDTAPDGSAAFGFKPYVGVLGGYERFDPRSDFGVVPGRGVMTSPSVEGVAGVNVPLGPVFVGVEGNAAKGISGDIDWRYGAAARAGFRAGDSGLIYGSFGRQWINGRRGFRDQDGWEYGIGVEVGPKDIGLPGLFGGSAGPRLRLEAKTYEFDSIRTMGGVVFHF